MLIHTGSPVLTHSTRTCGAAGTAAHKEDVGMLIQTGSPVLMHSVRTCGAAGAAAHKECVDEALKGVKPRGLPVGAAI